MCMMHRTFKPAGAGDARMPATVSWHRVCSAGCESFIGRSTDVTPSVEDCIFDDLRSAVVRPHCNVLTRRLLADVLPTDQESRDAVDAEAFKRLVDAEIKDLKFGRVRSHHDLDKERQAPS